MNDHLVTALSVLNNLQNEYPEIIKLLEAFCYIAALYLLISALFKAKDLNRPGSNISGANLIVQAVIAVLLFAAPSAIHSITITLAGGAECYSQFLGRGASPIYDYLSVDNCYKPNLTLAPVLTFMKVYGFFAFIRGLLHLNRASKPGQNQDLYTSGAVHCFFGVACININFFIAVIRSLFGY